MAWGRDRSAELLGTAMDRGDTPVARGEAETAGTSPGRGDSPFCPWPHQPSLCTASLWWHHVGGLLPALFLAGRLPVVGLLPPPAPRGSSRLPWALQPLSWVSAGGQCSH